MKKPVRIALLLIAAGLCIVLIALCLSRFDFGALLAKDYDIQTVAIEEAFNRIHMESDSFDMSIVSAGDGVCRVTCPVGEYAGFTAATADGELRIVSTEETPWFGYISVGISAKDSIIVELPQEEYAALKITSESGNISVDPKFSFAQVDIVCASGNIDCRASADALKATAASGNIAVSGADFGTVSLQTASGRISADDLHAETFSAVSSSGNQDMSQIRCGDLQIKTASGTAALSDVIAAGALQAETASGDIRLENCDADSLDLTAQSGDIRGTLLSPKRFEIAGVGSGRISVPESSDGGLCTLKTGSGDIRIEIAE